MFSAIRKHLIPRTFMAFVALVFAMTGGAFAASSNGGGSGAKRRLGRVELHARDRR